MINVEQTTADISAAVAAIKKIRAEIANAVVGQADIVEHVLACLLASGHVLLEGVPGLGKTLLVRALAKTFAGQFARIQFTPDLMPADVTGHAVLDLKNQSLTIRKGPIFTNLLLADEINRAPAKTQSALLEVMQERQVTIEGESHILSAPFMVLATQNPLEQEGTYPLPEAQLDRFLIKVLIPYPTANEEVDMVRTVTTARIGDDLNVSAVTSVIDAHSIVALQQLVAQIRVDESVMNYAVNLVRKTREWPGIAIGAGPRGSIALIRVARAMALLNERAFVTPDDVKQALLPVLRHRVTLAAESELDGVSIDQLLLMMQEDVPAPRS